MNKKQCKISRKRAFNLAIRCLEKEKQRLAFDAHMADMVGGGPPNGLHLAERRAPEDGRRAEYNQLKVAIEMMEAERDDPGSANRDDGSPKAAGCGEP